MEKVLVVAKTHLGPNKFCVGGLSLRACKNVRLLLPGDRHHPLDTPFEVGQVWDLALRAVAHPRPPHVEDMTIREQAYITTHVNLRGQLLQRIQPWKGGLTQLFDGCLQGERGKAFIARNSAVPLCSTGYWLTTIPLTLTRIGYKAYYTLPSVVHQGQDFYRDTFTIPYVGIPEPLPEIPANTLIRVSLARWWRREEYEEERCYLQISGWYI